MLVGEQWQAKPAREMSQTIASLFRETNQSGSNCRAAFMGQSSRWLYVTCLCVCPWFDNGLIRNGCRDMSAANTVSVRRYFSSACTVRTARYEYHLREGDCACRLLALFVCCNVWLFCFARCDFSFRGLVRLLDIPLRN